MVSQVGHYADHEFTAHAHHSWTPRSGFVQPSVGCHTGADALSSLLEHNSLKISNDKITYPRFSLETAKDRLWAAGLRQGWPLFMYVHILAERYNFVCILRLPLEGDAYIREFVWINCSRCSREHGINCRWVCYLVRTAVHTDLHRVWIRLLEIWKINVKRYRRRSW